MAIIYRCDWCEKESSPNPKYGPLPDGMPLSMPDGWRGNDYAALIGPILNTPGPASSRFHICGDCVTRIRRRLSDALDDSKAATMQAKKSTERKDER